MQKKTNERFYGEDDCLLNTLTDNVAEHGGVYSRFKRKMKNGAVFGALVVALQRRCVFSYRQGPIQ